MFLFHLFPYSAANPSDILVSTPEWVDSFKIILYILIGKNIENYPSYVKTSLESFSCRKQKKKKTQEVIVAKLGGEETLLAQLS